jgi:hypothetical protein
MTGLNVGYPMIGAVKPRVRRQSRMARTMIGLAFRLCLGRRSSCRTGALADAAGALLRSLCHPVAELALSIGHSADSYSCPVGYGLNGLTLFVVIGVPHLLLNPHDPVFHQHRVNDSMPRGTRVYLFNEVPGLGGRIVYASGHPDR